MSTSDSHVGVGEGERDTVLSASADHFFELISSMNMYTSHAKLFGHQMLRVVFC